MAKEGWSRKGKRYKWWYVCIIAGRWVDAEYLVGSKGVRGGVQPLLLLTFCRLLWRVQGPPALLLHPEESRTLRVALSILFSP